MSDLTKALHRALTIPRRRRVQIEAAAAQLVGYLVDAARDAAREELESVAAHIIADVQRAVTPPAKETTP